MNRTFSKAWEALDFFLLSLPDGKRPERREVERARGKKREQKMMAGSANPSPAPCPAPLRYDDVISSLIRSIGQTKETGFQDAPIFFLLLWISRHSGSPGTPV